MAGWRIGCRCVDCGKILHSVLTNFNMKSHRNIHVKAVRPLTFCLASACSRAKTHKTFFSSRVFKKTLAGNFYKSFRTGTGTELSHIVNGNSKIFRIQCLDTPLFHLFGPNLTICVDGYGRNRLGYQPLFGKGARAPPPKVLLGEGRGPDTRERRKSSLFTNWSTSCEHDFYWLHFVSLTLFESDFWNRQENKEASFDLNSYAGKRCSFNEKRL